MSSVFRVQLIHFLLDQPTSIDDFAWHDIPDSIQYVLDLTKAPALSYIGFSQGTAQAFAALSIHPQLNKKINVFIALAPALSPAGLAATIVDGLMKASYVHMSPLLFNLCTNTQYQSNAYVPFLWPEIHLVIRGNVAVYHIPTNIYKSH